MWKMFNSIKLPLPSIMLEWNLFNSKLPTCIDSLLYSAPVFYIPVCLCCLQRSIPIHCQYTLSSLILCLTEFPHISVFYHFCDQMSLDSRIVNIFFKVLDTIACSSYTHRIKFFLDSVFLPNYYLFCLFSVSSNLLTR